MSSTATQKPTQLSYAFGTTTIDLRINGPINDMDELHDQLLSAALAHLAGQYTHSGLTMGARGEFQKMSNHRVHDFPFSFGIGDDITIAGKITVDLNYDVPVAVLTRIVYDGAFKGMSGVIGQRLGDRQVVITTPPNHEAALTHDELQWHLDSAAGLTPQASSRRPGEAFLPDASYDQSGRSRQTVTQ